MTVVARAYPRPLPARADAAWHLLPPGAQERVDS